MRAWTRGVVCAVALGGVFPIPGEAQGRTHAVVVVGLGGTDDYRLRFHEQAKSLFAALSEKHGLPAEDIAFLSETVAAAPEIIDGRSTRENVLEALAGIAESASPMDRLVIFLIGHGTSDREDAQFNLPGPDITPTDLQLALTAFPTQTVAIVHMGSASGGFVAPLSAQNRIVITATRSARELNFAEFGKFFVDAMTGDGADLDKDGRISLLEAFVFARAETERYYEEENELLTEHAMLDDNGDGEGTHEAGLAGPDGMLAATFQLGGVSGTAAQVPDDPTLARLYGERTEIQGRITALRALRESMAEDAYLADMEELLVELALKSREIRVLEGGGG